MERNKAKMVDTISQKIDIYADEILRKNFRNFSSFIFDGTLLTGIIAVLAIIGQGRIYFTPQHCALFAYFAL